MRLVFAKSKWEAPELTLKGFAERAKAAGFDAVELNLAERPEPAADIRRLVLEHGLELAAQVICPEQSAKAQLLTFEKLLGRASDCGAVAANCHLGSDTFEFGANVELFVHAEQLAKAAGLPCSYETHRGRPTYSAPSTAAILAAIPSIRLTADLSHWVCVHESLLGGFEREVELAISRSDWIHARVGFPEGPQVGHPFAPENRIYLEAFTQWWRRIAHARRRQGAAVLLITPEAGPPPYMPIAPFTQLPVADAWDSNLAMHVYLRNELTRTGS